MKLCLDIVRENLAMDTFSPTIFHEDWWLDIATGGKASVAEVTSNGKVVGRLPYFLERRNGFTICRMPTLTRFLALGSSRGKATSVRASSSALVL